MPDQRFKASLSRSQGRRSWCVIFRHPLRPGSDGRPGLRVRRGLGTEDAAKAEELVGQLNQILSDESFWKPSAREIASRRFDKLVVDTFYEEIEVRAGDPWSVREETIPMPTPADGYTRVFLVGATGSGKTTLLRQLIGSHPTNDRFPSISTAKTTIFDTEIILAPGEYRCVVSFLPRDRVRSYIEECVIAAISAAAGGSSRDTVIRKLLEHSEQRFRLSYLLGTLPEATEEGDDEYPDEEDASSERQLVGDAEEQLAQNYKEERERMQSVLSGFVQRVFQLTDECRKELEERIGDMKNANPDDLDAFLELLEGLIYENEEAQKLIDDILAEVESRFSLLQENNYERDHSDWPQRWVFNTADRRVFIRTVNRFTSNYAPEFGRLLAPAVQGLRVAGPFRPSWYSGGDGIPRLVFIDGEGLGHTPASASTLPTAVTRRYDVSDVILLVDNAIQPMQAAAQAVLRSVTAGGHDSKLVVVFTHLDEVKGDNLPTLKVRRDHVRASLDNAIDVVDVEPGSYAGRRLSRNLDGKVFFVARIQELLSPKPNDTTRRELVNLVQVLEKAIQPVQVPVAVPVYDLANLVLCVRLGTEQFHEHWNSRLGLGFKSGVTSEHWTRIKALSRRFAYQWEDQYDSLRPVADLIKLLSERLVLFITKPRGWEPLNPPKEACDAAIANVEQKVYSRLHKLAKERLFNEQLAQWGIAYGHRGAGSTFTRARDIRGIYEIAAPVPGEAPVPEASNFLDVIRELFREAARDAGAEIIG
jgi:GTPase SAR1 family protein